MAGRLCSLLRGGWVGGHVVRWSEVGGWMFSRIAWEDPTVRHIPIRAPPRKQESFGATSDEF
jgi:hypothetical protein